MFCVSEFAGFSMDLKEYFLRQVFRRLNVKATKQKEPSHSATVEIKQAIEVLLRLILEERFDDVAVFSTRIRDLAERVCSVVKCLLM